MVDYHFNQSVLQSLPEQQRDLDEKPAFMPPMSSWLTSLPIVDELTYLATQLSAGTGQVSPRLRSRAAGLPTHATTGVRCHLPLGVLTTPTYNRPSVGRCQRCRRGRSHWYHTKLSNNFYYEAKLNWYKPIHSRSPLLCRQLLLYSRSEVSYSK